MTSGLCVPPSRGTGGPQDPAPASVSLEQRSVLGCSVLRMFLVQRGESGRGKDNGDPWSASPLPCFLWLLVHDARQESTKMRACCGIIAVLVLLGNLKALAAQGEFLTCCLSRSRSGWSGIGCWPPSRVDQLPALG